MKRLRAAVAKGKKTLYRQLLARSLFVLAVLLLLIGAFQYFLMRGFLYQNQVETLEAQFRSIPPFMVEELRSASHTEASNSGFSAPAANKKGSLAGEDEQQTQPLSAESSAPNARNDSAGKPGESKDENAPNRRPFLLSGLSLAEIRSDGTASDLNAEYGLPAPVLTSAQYSELRRDAEQPGGRGRYILAADANGKEQLVVLRPVVGKWMLQVGSPTGPLTAILWRQLAIFGALSGLALAGGLALYRPVLRRSLSPLSRMVGTVKEIDAGRLGERFPAQQGQAEIDRLAASFNGMLERLEAAFAAERESQERMRRFIADASHELRTPLTSIRGFLEVLLRGSRISEEQLRSALRSMHSESQRMTQLVEDLLSLVKLDGGLELHRTPVRPAELLRELEAHLRMLAGERTVTLNITEDENLQVWGDAGKLKQIILNLFGNAVQHTDAREGQIGLSLYAVGGLAAIEVRDNGPGIPPELQQKVFERFYRGDESRSRRSGGAGLGLAISQALAEAHGGTIELDSVPGKGSTFRLLLPLMEVSADRSLGKDEA